ncbi:tetratricopeptide repeat protein [Pseudoxanthomonas suwonensis]
MVSTPVLLFGLLALCVVLAVSTWVLLPLARRGAIVAGVAALCAGTFALYLMVGTPEALRDPSANIAEPASLEEAVAQLATELERNPDQPEGWALLARSYSTLGNHDGARDAYARALQLAPDEPDLLVDAAEARALAHPQRLFDEQSMAWLQRARQLRPDHARAGWFIGVAQRQAGQAAEAARTWESLLSGVDEATARSLRVQIDAARADAGLPPLDAPATVAPGQGLKVKVALDPAFAERARLDGEAAVFVLARVPGGPPMPVAVERHRVRDLPLEVVLDDRDSPMPTQKLSTMDEVEVLARISAAGSANRGEGDVESAPVRVRLPAEGTVELTLGAPAP